LGKSRSRRIVSGSPTNWELSDIEVPSCEG
jgi:hypothetical protein